jgi:hypothetical protein
VSTDHQEALFMHTTEIPTVDVYPRYIVPQDGTVSREDEQWIRAQNGEGPLRVADVADLCDRFKVTATLHDANGEQIGQVFANGRYRLE